MINVAHNPARGWRPYSVTFEADGGEVELWFHTTEDVADAVRKLLAAAIGPSRQRKSWLRRRVEARS